MSFLAVAGGAHAAVVCHSEDGHVAIEAATDEGCVKAPSDHCPDDAETSAEHQVSPTDNCGECVDIPLSIGMAIIVKKPCKTNPAAPLSTAIDPAIVSSSDFSQYHSAPDPFAPPPYFTPLRSIILII